MTDHTAHEDNGEPAGRTSVQRRLLQIGAVLFLAGLITGFAVAAVKNPRMGLAAHLEGVMNGTFLLALGAAWGHIRLGPVQEKVAFWSLAFGTTVNWLTTFLAAVWGTGRLTPIAGAGFAAREWQELIVSVGFITVGIWMLIGCTLVVFGVFRRAPL